MCVANSLLIIPGTRIANRLLSGRQKTRAAFSRRGRMVATGRLRRVRYSQRRFQSSRYGHNRRVGMIDLNFIAGSRDQTVSMLEEQKDLTIGAHVRGRNRLWHPIKQFVGIRTHQRRCKSSYDVDRRLTHVECCRTPKGIYFLTQVNGCRLSGFLQLLLRASSAFFSRTTFLTSQSATRKIDCRVVDQ